MKKFAAVSLCLLLAMFVVFANGQSEKADGQVKIILSDINNAESIPGKADQAFADLVYERSNGRIVIETFLGGQLGKEAENIENLRSGAVGITRINVGNLETRGIDVPEYSLFGLPYLLQSKEHAEAFFYGPDGLKLADKIDQVTNGEIVALNGYVVAPPRSFFFKTEVKTMAEAAGKKVRSETTPMKVDMMKFFGMSATPLGLNDMYSALQTGMIEGAEHNISNYKSYALYEQCPYFLLTRNNYAANIYIMSGVLSDQLSEEDFQLINDCCKEVCLEYSNKFAEADKTDMEALKAKGVVFNEPTDIDEWQAAAQKLYKKYATGYDEFIDLVLSYAK